MCLILEISAISRDSFTEYRIRLIIKVINHKHPNVGNNAKSQ